MQEKEVLELRWGNTIPISYNDINQGKVDLKFLGVCYYYINDVSINREQLENMLYNKIVQCLNKIVLQNQNKDYTDIGSYICDDLKQNVISTLNDENIIIDKIVIHNTNVVTSEQKVKASEFVINPSPNNVTTQAVENLEVKENNVTIIKTDEGAKDGQNKCPKCGSTEISINTNNGHLRCGFCRHEFELEKVVGMETDISQLQGQIMGSGAQDIVDDTNDVLTFKCSSCGSEVVIDTSEATQARCHWCRSTLSVNQQIPNGSIPDVVLPFTVKKEEAKVEIEKFVGKRKFFAHPKFKQEFTTANIMGVYFPYMAVDINAHSNLIGQGEHTVRKYTRKQGDRYVTYYDADVYDVQRDFDVVIEGLTIESSADKLNKAATDKTTNVINAIMPFDIENAVKWNANYLKGFSSEKRDTNIEQLKPIVEKQSKDIAKFAANETLQHYDRGVAWSTEQMTIKGQQWKAAYLPVWLYSYQQVKGDKKMLHYVAVNARTKETMGSVPIHMPKLFGISFLVELLGVLATIFVDSDYSGVFLLAGFVYFFIMFSKYRNQGARHKHELETKRKMSNVRVGDRLVTRRNGLTNPNIQGANNKSVSGEGFMNQMFSQFTNQNNSTNNNK